MNEMNVIDTESEIMPRCTIVSTGLCIILILAGCDSAFEPFQEHDEYHFSIFGSLDASADTNWVRVMPLRDSIYLTSPETIDAIVTLENLTTGEIHVMQDSLFLYREEAYAWNFWTTMEIEPESTYQIRAENSSGIISKATVTIPSHFGPPVIFPTNDGDIIQITDIDQLVDLALIYHVNNRTIEEEFQYKRSYTEDGFREFSRGYRILVSRASDYQQMQQVFGENLDVLKTEVEITVAGNEWPDFINMDLDELFMPDHPYSNVEGGLGFVGSVFTRVFPFQSCQNENGLHIPCPE